MRNIFLLSCLFFLPFLVFPQEAVTKADSVKNGGLYLDVSAGWAAPMGYFAKTDPKNANSGFATQGFLGQVNLDWIGKGNIGLALQYTFQSNPLDKSVKQDTLSGMSIPIGTGSWTNHYLMAGLVFMHIVHKVYIEGRVLVGLVLSSSPLFKSTAPGSQKVSTNTGIGTAYSAQFGIGYNVSPRIALKASAEFLLGDAKIHHQYGAEPVLDTTTASIIYTPPVTVETKRAVSSFFLKAGIVVKLSK